MNRNSLRSALRLFPAVAAGVAVLSLVACDVPVGGTEDTPEPATRIEGTVRVEIDSGLPLGPTILFRYDCANPPPPAGSGRPVDFLIVDERDFVNGEADYAFPTVPASTCALLTGFIDRDRDFHFAFNVTAQATKGDVAVDAVIVETEMRPLDGDDYIEPTTGVLLRARTEVPFDRPAFVAGVNPDTGLLPPMDLAAPDNVVFPIAASQISTDLVSVDSPVFTVVFAPDLNGDGIPDDNDGNLLPDTLFPRILAFKLDPEDPNGLTAADPPVVLVGAVITVNPEIGLNLVGEALALGQSFDGATILPKSSLLVALAPLVLVSSDPVELAPLPAVAQQVDVIGNYRILVMNSTGQAWQTPNELVAYGLADQALTLQVVDSSAQ